MSNYKGFPYPIRKTPKGFLYSQNGTNQIKSDLLQLLLTNPGERVMNPFFGTPLKQLAFDQNDAELQLKARNMILNSIKRWEPRVTIQNLEVSSNIDKTALSKYDNKQELDHILFIRIMFVDPQNIKDIQELVLEVPLSGGA